MTSASPTEAGADAQPVQPARPAWRRGLRLVFFALLSLGGWWLGWGDWPAEESDPLPAQVDAIVVLGGGAAERPRQAWKLYEEGRADCIIVTGDGGSIVSSLEELGVPPQAIVHETDATSTLENARNVAPLLAERQVHTAILVTTWSHGRRARRTFAQVIPGVQFFLSTEPRPAVLDRWQLHYQRRERFAAVYHMLVSGLWCF